MTSTPPPPNPPVQLLHDDPPPPPPQEEEEEELVVGVLPPASRGLVVGRGTPRPPRTNTTTIDFAGVVTWNDVAEDDEGKATSVLGISWELFSSKQLRTICSQLEVRGVKNAKKNDMIDKICGVYQNKKRLSGLQQDKAPRKEVQCVFRLINILFSDEFCEEFATLGNVADRALLDSGRAGNDEHFWVRVQSSFVKPHPEYDLLDFVMSDDVFLSQDHIDPGKIVNHDWKKLRSIWKGVNAEYKAAYARYTVSGTHDDNFYSFCFGKLDVYYLRKKLDGKPQLSAFVQADLPEGCALASDDIIPPPLAHVDITSATPSSKSTRPGTRSPVPANINDNLAGAISAIGVSQNQQMIHDEAWRKKEDTRRDNEDSRRDRKVKLDEWERIQQSLRCLRADINRNAEVSEEDKRDMQRDYERLKRRKNDLALVLGWSLDEDHHRGG